MNTTTFDTNRLIRASAGTGKTYQLSSRYLARLFGGLRPDQILATTFTRKAAGEIQERVLQRLADAALDEMVCHELGAAIGAADLTCEAAAAKLHELIRELHRMNISTLDAFFNRLASTYTFELGLPTAWRLFDEAEVQSLRARAVEDLLNDAETADVVSLVHMLDRGETRARVLMQLLSSVTAFYDAFAESGGDEERWNRFEKVSVLTDDERHDLVARRAEMLDALPGPSKNAKSSQSNVQKATAKLVDAFDAGDIGEFVKGTLIASIADGTNVYGRKPLPDSVAAVLRAMLDHVAAVAQQGVQRQTLATFRLLDRFDTFFRARKREARGLQFDDVKRRLSAELSQDGRGTADWSFRLDSEFRELLLDEFQDTSTAEWDVVRELAEPLAASAEGGVFCVGDLKQAIYGWRGGLAEIFDRVESTLQDVVTSTSELSYRSAPVVIGTVNKVFTSLTTHPNLDDVTSQAAKQFAARFKEHATTKAFAGYAALEVLPRLDEDTDGEEQDASAAYLDAVAERVAALHQTHPGCSVGVLTRANAAVTGIASRLRSRGIDASEEGGQPVTDSPAVQLLMSLLRLANHPADSKARFHVARSPLADALGFAKWRDAGAASTLSWSLRTDLSEFGFADALHRWSEHLVPHSSSRDVSRMRQLVELAAEFDARGSTCADEFRQLLETSTVGDPTSHPVRVMTVHQSKGLEFDVVVVTELEKPPHQLHRRGFVVGRADDLTVDRVYRYVGKGELALLPRAIQETFERAAADATTEFLCGFYVALTRAVRGLHLLVRPWDTRTAKGQPRTVPKSAAGFLNATLCGVTDLRPGTVAWSDGDVDWCEAAAGDVNDRQQATPVEIRLRPGDDTPAEVSAPSDDVRHARWQTFSPGHATRRGSLLHLWLAAMPWSDQRPEEDALRLMAFEAGFYESEIAASTSLLTRFLQSDAARILRRADGAEVRTEQPFEVTTEAGLLRGTFDRVVITPDSVTVTDWKTDRVRSENDLRQLRKTYRPQLDRYREAAARLFGRHADQVHTQLVFVEDGVIDVTGDH